MCHNYFPYSAISAFVSGKSKTEKVKVLIPEINVVISQYACEATLKDVTRYADACSLVLPTLISFMAQRVRLRR